MLLRSRKADNRFVTQRNLNLNGETNMKNQFVIMGIQMNRGFNIGNPIQGFREKMALVLGFHG